MKKIISNNDIRAKEVYVVEDNKREKMSFKDAMFKAKSECLDLVQVAVEDSVPICKILDKNKYSYIMKKKEKNNKQKVLEMKEVRFTANTEENDIKIKERNIIRLLEKGHFVRVSIFLRGRERSNKEYYIPKLQKIVDDLSDVADVTKAININGNYISVTLKKK